MAKLAILSRDEIPAVEYPERWHTESVCWAKRLSPEEYALGLIVAELDAGGSLRWDADHGD